MRWSIHIGDILDVPADVLVCSANVQLNLSGGVGGAFAMRYGPAMQQALHARLARSGLHFVRRGEVVESPPCGGPYRAVLHAVAIDAAYDTNPEVIANVIDESLLRAAALGARTVALTALGTGYGRMPLIGFAEALRTVTTRKHPPLELVVVGLRSRHDAEALTVALSGLETGSPP